MTAYTINDRPDRADLKLGDTIEQSGATYRLVAIEYGNNPHTARVYFHWTDAPQPSDYFASTLDHRGLTQIRWELPASHGYAIRNRCDPGQFGGIVDTSIPRH